MWTAGLVVSISSGHGPAHGWRQRGCPDPFGEAAKGRVNRRLSMENLAVGSADDRFVFGNGGTLLGVVNGGFLSFGAGGDVRSEPRAHHAALPEPPAQAAELHTQHVLIEPQYPGRLRGTAAFKT